MESEPGSSLFVLTPFSSREPVSTSLKNALAERSAHWLRQVLLETGAAFQFGKPAVEI
jgi:hypothetical protein